VGSYLILSSLAMILMIDAGLVVVVYMGYLYIEEINFSKVTGDIDIEKSESVIIMAVFMLIGIILTNLLCLISRRAFVNLNSNSHHL
jgi:hypothetical protein